MRADQRSIRLASPPGLIVSLSRVVAVAIALFLLAAGVYQLWFPRVLSTYPQDGALAGARPQIGVRFSLAMQPGSAEAAFSIQPAVKGSFTWQKNILWFRPTQALVEGIAYTVRMDSSAHSAKGQPLSRGVLWQFTVRQAQVIYMAPAGEQRELYRITLDGSAPHALTSTGGRVVDYAVSTDGEWVAYSASNPAGGADLWRVRRDGSRAEKLLSCGKDRCAEPAWSPDGRLIAYSRETKDEGSAGGFSPGRIHILSNLGSQNSSPLYTAPEVWGVQPLWSPDGRWLAFYDGAAKAVRVFDFQTGKAVVLLTQEQGAGTWSADSKKLIYNDLRQVGEALQGTLYQADFDAGSIAPLFADSLAGEDFGPPDWSPDGKRLAVGVRSLSVNEGRQIWLVDPATGNHRMVTNDPLSAYSALHWDAQGTRLVFQRYALGSSDSKPEVWYWDGTQLILLVKDATQPNWLP